MQGTKITKIKRAYAAGSSVGDRLFTAVCLLNRVMVGRRAGKARVRWRNGVPRLDILERSKEHNVRLRLFSGV